MSTFLFKEFDPVQPTAWKQKIQVDLKGADYNETLLWHTENGITVKPFYTEEDRSYQDILLPQKGFNICQSIAVTQEEEANQQAIDALSKGANAILFEISEVFDPTILLHNIDLEHTVLYFKFHFISETFIQTLSKHTHPEHTYFDIDIIKHLAATGNWYHNLKEDQQQLATLLQNIPNSLAVDASLYQNAGANHVQQLAYALAHANEYINMYGAAVASRMHFEFAVGSNYFFEIAKLRAFRILWEALAEEYKLSQKTIAILAKPSLRNKTLYDYNVNMLRTTSECMSAVLGGANTVCNQPYDATFHHPNEFGNRISRNQLLILQQESQFDTAQNVADGAYYIEELTQQLAQKALDIFKQIEQGGGFLKQLKDGVIQRKITENATKEQTAFDHGNLVLLGTNRLPNPNDQMENNIETYPFIKERKEKTLVAPIIQRRLSMQYEKDRLTKEKLWGQKTNK